MTKPFGTGSVHEEPSFEAARFAPLGGGQPITELTDKKLTRFEKGLANGRPAKKVGAEHVEGGNGKEGAGTKSTKPSVWSFRGERFNHARMVGVTEPTQRKTAPAQQEEEGQSPEREAHKNPFFKRIFGATSRMIATFKENSVAKSLLRDEKSRIRMDKHTLGKSLGQKMITKEDYWREERRLDEKLESLNVKDFKSSPAVEPSLNLTALPTKTTDDAPTGKEGTAPQAGQIPNTVTKRNPAPRIVRREMPVADKPKNLTPQKGGDPHMLQGTLEEGGRDINPPRFGTTTPSNLDAGNTVDRGNFGDFVETSPGGQQDFRPTRPDTLEVPKGVPAPERMASAVRLVRENTEKKARNAFEGFGFNQKSLQACFDRAEKFFNEHLTKKRRAMLGVGVLAAGALASFGSPAIVTAIGLKMAVGTASTLLGGISSTGTYLTLRKKLNAKYEAWEKAGIQKSALQKTVWGAGTFAAATSVGMVVGIYSEILGAATEVKELAHQLLSYDVPSYDSVSQLSTEDVSTPTATDSTTTPSKPAIEQVEAKPAVAESSTTLEESVATPEIPNINHRVVKDENLWSILRKVLNTESPDITPFSEEQDKKIQTIINKIAKSPKEFGISSGNVDLLIPNKDELVLPKSLLTLL